MKKKIILIIFLLIISISTVKANKIINYDWSFDETNYNLGAGLNSVIYVENNYYVWHIDNYDYINVISKYDENGKLIKTYEPEIESPIVDLIYYDNQFIAIDYQANIYKLDKNFNITSKTTNSEDDYYISSSMSELKIANNKIYYIDKSDYYLYYTDYELSEVKEVDLTDTDTPEDAISLVPFISDTDKIYFKYLSKLYEETNEEDYIEITDIYKKNNLYYITGYQVINDVPTSFIKIIDNNLNTVWEDNSRKMSISISLSFYKDYLITMYIAPDRNYNTVKYLKIYDRNNNLIAEEEIPQGGEDETPLAIIPDDSGLVIKSIYRSLRPSSVMDFDLDADPIIIDKYTINIFNIKTETDGNGTITVKETAISGDTVSFVATPNENYILESLTITDEKGNQIIPNTNTFIMPSSNVIITAKFQIKNPETMDYIYYTIPLFAISLTILLVYQYKRYKK